MKRLIFFFIIFSFSKNLIFFIQKLDIVYNSINTFKNPLFLEKKLYFNFRQLSLNGDEQVGNCN